MTVGCSLTWSDISARPFWCDWGMCSHLIRYKGWCHSLGEWRHLVSYQEPSVLDWEPFWHGERIKFLTWSNVRAGPFWHDGGCVPLMVRCECWACLSDMVLDVFLPWSDVRAGPLWHDGGCVPLMVRCEYWVCHSDMGAGRSLPWSDISVGRAFMTGSYISVEEDEYLPRG